MLTAKIGVIGAGKIGAAIIRGIIRAGLARKEQVMASDVSEELREAVVKELDIKATADNGVLCDFADIRFSPSNRRSLTRRQRDRHEAWS